MQNYFPKTLFYTNKSAYFALRLKQVLKKTIKIR